ncbi:MAG: 3-methyl-2-oxobutanoate hydroxymethyltransferase [Planctomycetota bacterium]
MREKKVTTEALRQMKVSGERIVALTAYDYFLGAALDAAGVDMLLVGDSVGTVVQGHDTTLSVTFDQIRYHAEMVSRSASRAFVVADMPFLSYQVSEEEALRNAGVLFKESHVEAVKIEGGREVANTVRRLVSAGIPVMGHLGLTPQSIHQFGSYKVRGADESESRRIREDARALQEAGAFGVVLEKIPAGLGKIITGELEIPTIGIGAGPDCDGQILVTHDMLGLFTRFRPRFVRRYAELEAEIRAAVARYVQDVRTAEFPGEQESY